MIEEQSTSRLCHIHRKEYSLDEGIQVSGFSSGELQTVRLPLKSVDHRTYSSCFAHLCYACRMHNFCS
ncbi:Man1-Src1p-carboxy-terminal domain protein [Trifolium repens]|nr:Man1-Src1p-carboxy-terminal domain protein [Trifolium repens]